MTTLEMVRDRVMAEAGLDEFAAGMAVRATLEAILRPNELVRQRASEIYASGGWREGVAGGVFPAFIEAILEGKA